MGFIKQSKVGTITADAERALAEGRDVFVARYWDEILNFQGTGSVSGAAEAIENVEAAGWRMIDFSYSWVPEKKRGVTVMVFRPSADESGDVSG